MDPIELTTEWLATRKGPLGILEQILDNFPLLKTKKKLENP